MVLIESVTMRNFFFNPLFLMIVAGHFVSCKIGPAPSFSECSFHERFCFGAFLRYP